MQQLSHSNCGCAQVDKLAKLVTPQTRAVVTNAPHNPTGALPSHKEWARIVELCRGCGAYLFSDEMYWCDRASACQPELPMGMQQLPAVHSRQVTGSGACQVALTTRADHGLPAADSSA